MNPASRGRFTVGLRLKSITFKEFIRELWSPAEGRKRVPA